MLLTVDRLAGRVSEHNIAIDNAVIAFRDFARERPARDANLNRHLVNVGHMMPRFGYEISRRHLSLNDLVLAYRSIMSA